MRVREEERVRKFTAEMNGQLPVLPTTRAGHRCVRRSANARKYRDYSGERGNYKYAAIWGGFLADEPVSGEPVCEANSLLTGKKTGNFMKIGPFGNKLAINRPSERSKIS